MHVLATEAPTVGEYFPATQPVHVLASEAPTVVEYFPGSHAVQGTAPGLGL